MFFKNDPFVFACNLIFDQEKHPLLSNSLSKSDQLATWAKTILLFFVTRFHSLFIHRFLFKLNGFDSAIEMKMVLR